MVGNPPKNKKKTSSLKKPAGKKKKYVLSNSNGNNNFYLVSYSILGNNEDWTEDWTNHLRITYGVCLFSFVKIARKTLKRY